MNFTKKLGQLFFVGFEGYALSKETKRFLQTVQPGGIILFECNIKDKKQVKNLIKEINNCLEINPFLAIDQEGGSVERLRNICTSLPSVWGLSKLGLNELLSAQKIIISDLLELGFNMNFAPVLDINSNPKNPIIGTRAIGNDPKIVSEYGSKIIELHLKNNIIPVGKHFPGHGDLTIDSHLSLPVLNKSKSKLNSFELIPFKKAIQKKIPALMMGHIQLPQIESDKKRPTSLSKNILKGLLRNELGFKGLIITDELNMKGVTKNYSLEAAAYEAINSGADMALFNWDEKHTLKAFEYTKQKIKDKSLVKRIDESYKRIISVKKKLLHCRDAVNRVSTAARGKISYQLATNVTHWIKRDLFFMPMRKNDQVEVIYPITPKLREKDLEEILKELGIKKYRLIDYSLNPGFESIKKVLNKIGRDKRKVFISYDVAARAGQKSLIKGILDKHPDLIVISAGLEHDIEVMPKIKNFISAYAPNYISLKAAFEKLTFS